MPEKPVIYVLILSLMFSYTEMYHKYKALLQNMPTRHLLTKKETNIAALRKQINRLVHVDIVNFFIAASPEEISEVLAAASDPTMEDGPYFSDEFAWYSMSMVRLDCKAGIISYFPNSQLYSHFLDSTQVSSSTKIPQCSHCNTNVSVVHLSPVLAEKEDERRRFLDSQGKVKTDKLTDMFYFDLTVDAITAVGYEIEKTLQIICIFYF